MCVHEGTEDTDEIIMWTDQVMLLSRVICVPYVCSNLIPFSQEHIDRAIELKPDEPLLHYLNGRWSFEVAGISWLEKKAAAALFATPPESTYHDALQCFMKCEELSSSAWKANKMMIGKVSKTPVWNFWKSVQFCVEILVSSCRAFCFLRLLWKYVSNNHALSIKDKYSEVNAGILCRNYYCSLQS